MTEQKPTIVSSIANIRNSIFAKIQSADTADNKTVPNQVTDDRSDCQEADEVSAPERQTGGHGVGCPSLTHDIHNAVIKTEIEDDGYPVPEDQGYNHTANSFSSNKNNTENTVNGNEDDHSLADHDMQSKLLPGTCTDGVIKVEAEDSADPFQGNLAQTSTDFSQLMGPDSNTGMEEIILKQERPHIVHETEQNGDVILTRVEYRIVDSDYGESGTDEASAANSPSVSDGENFPQDNISPLDEDDLNEELFGKPLKKNCRGFDEMRTQGELFPEELPPIEELTIDIGENTELQGIGVVDSVVGVLVIVRSTKEHSPLNDDTVFFLENRKPLGQVFEVMGQVQMPFYSIRFNSEEDIFEKGVEVGKRVLFAPAVAEITHYVFMSQLKKLKGSDASWENNNEPPESQLDYSDDETERKAKGRGKNRRRTDHIDSSTDEEKDGADTGGKKSKQRRKKHENGEVRGRGHGRRGAGRGNGRGGNQYCHSHSSDQPSGRWPPSDWASKRFGPSGHPPHFDWDKPGNTGPPPFQPPRPPPDPSCLRPQPWSQRGPGLEVLRSPRFPPRQFAPPTPPPPQAPNLWNSSPFVPPAASGSGSAMSYCGHRLFCPPAGSAPPKGFQPFTAAQSVGNAPVFNPNIPPPPLNMNIAPTSCPSPVSQTSSGMRVAVNNGFGSQPQFPVGPWGAGSPASFGASAHQGTTDSLPASGTSHGQQSFSGNLPARTGPLIQTQSIGAAAVSTSTDTGNKPPVLDTRYIQNAGQ